MGIDGLGWRSRWEDEGMHGMLSFCEGRVFVLFTALFLVPKIVPELVTENW